MKKFETKTAPKEFSGSLEGLLSKSPAPKSQKRIPFLVEELSSLRFETTFRVLRRLTLSLSKLKNAIRLFKFLILYELYVFPITCLFGLSVQKSSSQLALELSSESLAFHVRLVSTLSNFWQRFICSVIYYFIRMRPFSAHPAQPNSIKRHFIQVQPHCSISLYEQNQKTTA